MTTTNSPRITAFAIQSSGSRSFGLDVNGVKILITAEEGRHDAALALAERIAALGPEGVATATSETRIPALDPQSKPVRKPFEVGQRVWCRVSGCAGWCTVTEVGLGRNRGRIKISGERAWCPDVNFLHEAPEAYR